MEAIIKKKERQGYFLFPQLFSLSKELWISSLIQRSCLCDIKEKCKERIKIKGEMIRMLKFPSDNVLLAVEKEKLKEKHHCVNDILHRNNLYYEGK